MEFANFILGRMTGADVVREVAPVYARLVPEQEALALAAALRRPVAQKALAVQLALIPLSGKAREQKEKAGRPAVSAFTPPPKPGASMTSYGAPRRPGRKPSRAGWWRATRKPCPRP
ncbi:hypothetical protein LP420_37280 [Massilia sp. B-10]|nr:hypothetical protein LP420_37280 [Massilia sp. B-10]